jgi:OHCU decarboxylase
MTLQRLNRLTAADAERELLGCCGAKAWAAAVARRRPFADLPALLAAADDVWWGLPEAAWREAFAAHPSIGERATGRSAREQAGVHGAGADTRAALADGNRAYEERFGHVFLICATGLSAEEMLAALRRRMAHDAATELGVAAGEQRKITRLRLELLARTEEGETA